MTGSSLLKLVDRAYATLDRVPLSVPLLVARIATFSVFLRSGLVKLSDWQGTLMLFRDEYKVPVLPPELAAYMAAGMELGCSTLILLGLLTRISVLGLFGMIATIQIFVYPTAWPDHIQWTGFMLFLLLRGPGVLSIDHLVARRRSS
ncbi:DoxX family protein [Sphingomonas sp. PR090111-T3T-6A]|uniref:DoxX family protein n=1 Tax=Sphingomonas sp. PR090111-T3T-6A TaxID=685778 RepID=UPI00036102CE|nr:DoxX family protein [Sphingomonas sp. PR090111-T3T-6A]